MTAIDNRIFNQSVKVNRVVGINKAISNSGSNESYIPTYAEELSNDMCLSDYLKTKQKCTKKK